MIIADSKIPCPQHSARSGNPITSVVLHYCTTGLEAVDLAKRFAARPQRQASYHFIVGRDGHVVQCVDLDRASWHAKGVAVGDDKYYPSRNNRRSIGICLSNRGFSRDPRPNVFEQQARGSSGRMLWWEVYPIPQINRLMTLLYDLDKEVPTLRYLSGHSDHTHGKVDPGPLLNMELVARGSGLTLAKSSRTTSGKYVWSYEQH